jgi:hypothetical protein
MNISLHEKIYSTKRAVTDIELAVFAHLLEVSLEDLLRGKKVPPDASRIKEILNSIKASLLAAIFAN